MVFLALVDPVVQQPVHKREDGSGSPREDGLRRVVCLSTEIEQDFEEQRRVIRQEGVELYEFLIINRIECRLGVLFDFVVHERLSRFHVGVVKDSPNRVLASL